MINTNQNLRWYDKDPTVSLSVSILRNTNEFNQLQIAEILIEKGKKLNLKLNPFNPLFNRRWYDHNEKLSEAFEYFKMFPEEEQKLIAIEIIQELFNMDSYCSTL